MDFKNAPALFRGHPRHCFSLSHSVLRRVSVSLGLFVPLKVEDEAAHFCHTNSHAANSLDAFPCGSACPFPEVSPGDGSPAPLTKHGCTTFSESVQQSVLQPVPQELPITVLAWTSLFYSSDERQVVSHGHVMSLIIGEFGPLHTPGRALTRQLKPVPLPVWSPFPFYRIL